MAFRHVLAEVRATVPEADVPAVPPHRSGHPDSPHHGHARLLGNAAPPDHTRTQAPRSPLGGRRPAPLGGPHGRTPRGTPGYAPPEPPPPPGLRTAPRSLGVLVFCRYPSFRAGGLTMVFRVRADRRQIMRGVGAFLPAVGGPCLPDQATDGEDRVGEAEDCVDDSGAPLVAAGEPAESVLPGVSAFDMPTLTGLDGRLLPLVRNASVQAAFVERSAGPVRVAADVQVHADVVGQRPEVVQTVQGRGEQRGAVTVAHRPGHGRPGKSRTRPPCPSV